MDVRISRLDNGLTIVTDHMPHLETAALGVWVRVGSRNETETQHGLTHLLEHMAFKGTKRRSAREIAEQIEAVGGELNASTSVENTAYYARVLADDVPLAVDLLSDILGNSMFDPLELKREQHVILQEIGGAQDSPEDWAFDLMQETAWPGQPIGRTILGTPQTVRSFSPDSIREYLDKHYRAGSMVLSAAGKVDHDAIVKLAGECFGRFPEGPGAGFPAASYRGGENRRVRELMEAQLLLAFEGKPYKHPDYYAIQILAAILGGGMSSRLFQEVRETRGLCYAVYAFHWAFTDTGLFGIHAASGEEDLEELMPVLLGELIRAGERIDEEEVARARAQIRASLMMAMESPVARAGQIARQMMVYGRCLDPTEIVERIDAVTAEDVRRVAAETFASRVPTLSAVGPVGKLMEAGDIAERLGGARAAAPEASKEGSYAGLGAGRPH
ncbi:putative Zn-dependent peptidase [Breoghania corrubedonensis]|uniref:Putative Zn-dependent peptidase n=1 Tax=Breoghania corrubedonensis TaxID=665038 RepID=A0A2T5VES6_9HYPH|nr:pitrilysin family protein [Breoghania corrubedonensis]PTW62253.1 putative Zn-dependent peptidase [Breoghania corrubedonensis]